MNSLRKLISQIKWYEYLYMITFYVMLIVTGIVFESNIIVILNSFFGITATFFTSKGFWLGSVVALIQLIFYILLDFQNKYYGEVIVSLCIIMPLYISTLISWIKNRGKDETIKVRTKVSWKELCVVAVLAIFVFVVMYFLLRALNTANLVVSTSTFVLSVLSTYFLMRRSGLCFYIYIISDISTFLLWFSLVLNGEMNYIPTILNYLIYIILNICGIINWSKLKKQEVGSFDIIMNTLKSDL